MTSNIVVGCDGTDGGLDAVALALALVDAEPDVAHAVTVASIYPVDPYARVARATVADYERELREDAEERLAETRERCADRPDVAFEVRGGSSPARALHLLARERDAALIVVGRSHTNALTRPFVGSVTEQTLHGAPCAVLVAPTGYAARADAARLATIAVASDGGPEAAHALDVAVGLARGRDARVVVTQALEPLPTPYGGLATPYPLPERREQAQERLDAQLAAIPDVPVTGRAVEGLAVDVLSEAAAGADLLVVGSRGFGPVRRVLLGSVSSRLARRCDAPLLVVPRATEGDDAEAPADRVPGELDAPPTMP